MATDLTAVVAQLITQNQILTETLAQFKAGVAITSTLPTYTFASLPATGANGQLAWGSNVRKPGEAGGAGTGSVVYFNGATSSWYTTLNVAATA